MSWLLLVGLVTGSWLSLLPVQCSTLASWIQNTSCYGTSYGRTCFTVTRHHSLNPMSASFDNARKWCKRNVPGSSLIVIKSEEDQKTVVDLIGRQALANETIILDAQKLSANDSQNWSWVNGHQIIPDDVINGTERNPGRTAVTLYVRNNRPANSIEKVTSKFRFICEYLDSRPNFSHQANNRSYVAANNRFYVASEEEATWYDARSKCLSSGGDLASIADPNTIGNWSWLKEYQVYWIGLHRNPWFWNSTGDAITYTNWKAGNPTESAKEQCICIDPQCGSKTEDTTCEEDNDGKWRSCNCNISYAIVCQKEIATAKQKPPTTSADIKSSTNLSLYTTRTSKRTSSLLSSSSPADATTAFASSTLSPSTGSVNSSKAKQILAVLLSLSAVAFIVAALIIVVVIQKRKRDKRNEGSPMQSAVLSETVTTVYATVDRDNRTSGGTVPPGNTTNSEVGMPSSTNPTYASIQPMGEAIDMGKSVDYEEIINLPSTNPTYASVRPTSEAIEMGKSVDYADLDFSSRDVEASMGADKVAASLSPIYSQPYEPPSNKEYAEVFKPDKTPVATAPVINNPNAAGDQQNIYSIATAIPLNDHEVIDS